ncbi:MAG: cellulose biosynthesis protein BcsS [Hyphomicrobiaceae bacterium]
MSRRIPTLVLGGLLAAVAGSGAFADGMPSLKDSIMPAPAPAWSGMYFGGSIGYGWNDSTNRYRDSAGGASDVDESAKGGLVSAIWGFDWMLHQRFVVGAFVDYDWSNIKRGDTGDGLTINRGFAIGARVGMLVDPNTLAFITGGYTRAHFNNDGGWDFIDASDPGLGILHGRNSADFSGYFVGGGLEKRLSGNFFMRGEVRYAKYGSEITNSGVDFAGDTYVDKEDPSIVTARLGLVYKLGRNEGPLAMARGAPQDDRVKVINYGGVDVARNIWTVYSGGLMALNGDLTRNGLVARTFGWYSDIDGSAGGGKDRSMDAMLGYLHYFGSVSAIGYIGMEVRDINVYAPATSTRYKDTETGLKLALEVESGDRDPLYFALDSSYSTAFDTFYSQLRLGYNRNGLKIGPEGEIWSEEGDVTSRLGAFVITPFNLTPTLPVELSLSGGYQWVDSKNTISSNGLAGIHGGEGAYVNTTLKVTF